jgi:hypothetical protein
MRKLVLALMLLQTSCLLAATDKPNPADFPMKIHITSSALRMQYANGLTYTYQVLQTFLDGQQVELSASAGGVLALGDYPARVSTSVHAPKGWSSYDLVKGYDFLMPDGKIRTFSVSAISEAGAPAATTNP